MSKQPWITEHIPSAVRLFMQNWRFMDMSQRMRAGEITAELLLAQEKHEEYIDREVQKNILTQEREYRKRHSMEAR